MKRLMLYLGVRNPVWIIPLAMPIVLYGTQTGDRALLFGVVVALVIPITHALSWPLERVFPRSLHLVPLLTIAAVLVTMAELVIDLSGVFAGPRTIVLLRSLVVSGLLLYPGSVGPGAVRNERFSERMLRIGATTAAFLVGFALFFVIRRVAAVPFGTFSDTVAGGFLILAIGRMTVSAVHRVRRGRGISS